MNPISKLRLVAEDPIQLMLHKRFKLVCRQGASHRLHCGGINKLLGDIVAIARALLVGMNGPQPLSGFIEDNAGQEMRL